MLFLVTAMTGCTYSGQGFKDVTKRFDAAGNLTELRVTKGRSDTIGDPFGARALSRQSMVIQETGDNWLVGMGSRNNLKAGDIGPTLGKVLPYAFGIGF